MAKPKKSEKGIKAFKATYEVAAIGRRRDLLIARLAHWVTPDKETGLTPLLAGLEWDMFRDVVIRSMPATLSPNVITDSIRGLVASRLTPAKLRATAWRLAGNIPMMKGLRPVTEWTTQRMAEWVPVQVMEIVPSPTKFRPDGWLLTLLILAGTPAGITIESRWGDSQIRNRSLTLGFRRIKPGHPRDPGSPPFMWNRELTSLRFNLLLDPERDGQLPSGSEIECPGGCLAWNKRIFLLRARLDKAHACPHLIPVTKPCISCFHGTETCPAATHPRTYVVCECPVCHQPKALTDPRDEQCLECRYQNSRPSKDTT